MNFDLDALRELIAQSGQQELIVTVICIIGIAVAAANCFAGYRLMQIWVFLFGVVAGAAVGYWLGLQFPLSVPVRAVIIFVAAVLFGALAGFFQTAASMLLCGLMSFSLAWSLLLFLFGGGSPISFLITAAFVGILCGLLALLLKRPAIIVITAFCGGYTVWSSVNSLLGLLYSRSVYWGGIAALSVIGMIVQFVTTRKEGR